MKIFEKKFAELCDLPSSSAIQTFLLLLLLLSPLLLVQLRPFEDKVLRALRLRTLSLLSRRLRKPAVTRILTERRSSIKWSSSNRAPTEAAASNESPLIPASVQRTKFDCGGANPHRSVFAAVETINDSSVASSNGLAGI